jgi:ribosomal protein S18 acetylase RimI-like enzyme
MEIRLAQSRDIPGMIRLLQQVGALHAEGRPDLFVRGAQKYDEAQLEAILADENSPIFIAEEGDVLGYCFCQKQTVEGNACVVGRRELYIDDLCVDETARGQHVGAALYRHVCSWAKAQGYDYITLHVWDFPGSAEAFYRRMGLKNRYICMEQSLEDI